MNQRIMGKEAAVSNKITLRLVKIRWNIYAPCEKVSTRYGIDLRCEKINKRTKNRQLLSFQFARQQGCSEVVAATHTDVEPC
jgi:hypothetical protein